MLRSLLRGRAVAFMAAGRSTWLLLAAELRLAFIKAAQHATNFDNAVIRLCVGVLAALLLRQAVSQQKLLSRGEALGQEAVQVAESTSAKVL
jgi:hypothetical protein